jgi:hypothetical protein
LIRDDLPTPVAREVAPQLQDSLARLSADGVDGDAEGDALGLGELRLQVVGEVGLVEHDHRRSAAFPGSGQVALQSPDLEVQFVQSHDEEGDVDVGDEHLLADLRPRRLPRELAVPREDHVDQAVAEPDPVADDGQLAGLRLVAEPAGDLHEVVGVRRDDLPETAMLDDNPPRLEARSVCFE